MLGHSATEADDPEHAVAGDAVVAAVAKVERGPIENTLTIAGEFKPFQDVDVHAKVAGYIVDCNQMFFLTEESSPHAYITY